MSNQAIALTTKAARFIVRGLRAVESSATTEADRAYARALAKSIELAFRL